MMQKTIWIIGASSGIGRALAIKLDAMGHELILSSRRQQSLDELNQSLHSNHTVVTLDVADRHSVEHAVEGVTEQYKQIDTVLFMAGIYSPTAISDMDAVEARRIIDTNLLGAIHVVDCLLPDLRQQSEAQIVLCSSVAGYRGLPNGQPYSATKAALSNFAESLYLEMKPLGIDIKLISPGFVRTPLTDKNEFTMPMIIEPEQAAEAIVKGLASSSFEIHFPKRFTYLMKLLRILPYGLYFKLLKNHNNLPH